MLTLVTILAAMVAFAAILFGQISTIGLMSLVAIFGGSSLPMYSLCIPHTNAHLELSQMVSASASLVFIGGVGACAGPFTAATLMSMLRIPGNVLDRGRRAQRGRSIRSLPDVTPGIRAFGGAVSLSASPNCSLGFNVSYTGCKGLAMAI